MKVIRIKEMITNLRSSWSLNKFSLSTPNGNVRRTVRRIYVLMLGYKGLKVTPSAVGHPFSLIASKTDSALSSTAFADKLEYFGLFGGARSLLSTELSSPLVFWRAELCFELRWSVCGSLKSSFRSNQDASLSNSLFPWECKNINRKTINKEMCA